RLVHRVERGHQRQPVALTVDRPARPLEPPGGAVAVHPDDEEVAECPGTAQELDVPGVEDVEDAVGEDDGPAREPGNVEPGDDVTASRGHTGGPPVQVAQADRSEERRGGKA